jgi:hypothetical protein
MKTTKRRVYRVQWERKSREWTLRWPERHHASRAFFSVQRDAIQEGRVVARAEWADGGTPAQLVVHGKSGKILWEASYGRDPKRYPS